MKPPESPLLLVARILTKLFFWPTVIASSCALGVSASIWLKTSPGFLMVIAVLLVACAAIIFRAVWGFRVRMDRVICEQAALTAVLIGSTAGYIIAGCLVLGHTDGAWQPTWFELAIAGIAQATAIATYRWSLRIDD